METTAEPAGTARITQQQGGASAGKQWLVYVLAGQDLNGHPKIKPKPLNTEHLREKKGFLMSSLAAESNIAA